MSPLTPGQVATLLKHAQSTRLHALSVLAAGSGMRMGEMFGLHWPDVDLNRSTRDIRPNLVDGSLPTLPFRF